MKKRSEQVEARGDAQRGTRHNDMVRRAVLFYMSEHATKRIDRAVAYSWFRGEAVVFVAD
jgi:hypothetical protein